MFLHISCASAEGVLSLLDTFQCTYQLEPGDEVTGFVWMVNVGDEVVKAKAYLQDFSLPLGEEPLLTEPAGVAKRSNASWIVLPFTYFEVPPFTRFPIPYTVRVPKEPQLHGSYWSVIAIESAEEFAVTDPEGIRIQVIKRFAYQMIVELGERSSFAFRVLDQRIDVSQEARRLVFDVENEGVFAIKPQPTVTVIDADGKCCGLFSCPRQIVYPLSSARFYVDISSLVPGHYPARVVFKHNKDHLLTAEYAIDVPSNSSH